jgi:hypothetical protein
MVRDDARTQTRLDREDDYGKTHTTGHLPAFLYIRPACRYFNSGADRCVGVDDLRNDGNRPLWPGTLSPNRAISPVARGPSVCVHLVFPHRMVALVCAPGVRPYCPGCVPSKRPCPHDSTHGAARWTSRSDSCAAPSGNDFPPTAKARVTFMANNASQQAG